MTIRRGRPPARPSAPRPAPGPARVLAAYLAAAFVLLAVVFALRPAQGPPPAAPAWDYQRETVALEGGGTLNAYARWAVGTTASVTRGSIERQRDVHRLSPLDYLAGQRAASALAGWRERHRLPLEGATLAAVCALAAWGTLRRRPGRVWLAALLMLVGLTLLVTRPQTATTLAAKAGTEVPNLLLRAAATADPSGRSPQPPGRRRARRRRWCSGRSRPATGRRSWGSRCRGCRPGPRCWPPPRPPAKAGVLGIAAGPGDGGGGLGGRAPRARAGGDRHPGPGLRAPVRPGPGRPGHAGQLRPDPGVAAGPGRPPGRPPGRRPPPPPGRPPLVAGPTGRRPGPPGRRRPGRPGRHPGGRAHPRRRRLPRHAPGRLHRPPPGRRPGRPPPPPPAPARPRALPGTRSPRQPATRPSKPAILRGGAA